ncbi:50S ribosomal protein L5 [Candidatus Dojkabacteria bacterium]|nr:50S ribosomal protein L5 [Candidatus Dojkabacteria bacterium]
MDSFKQIHDKVRTELAKEGKYANIMVAPRLRKIVVNAGVGNGTKDRAVVEDVVSILTQITGQKPVETKANVAVSNFGIRRGDVVGVKVTLRGERMWSFAEKFLNIVLPRFRDFRGIAKKSIDQSGNLHIGVLDHMVFIEIDPNKVQNNRSFQVSLVANASSAEAGLEFFTRLGFPFIE